MKDKKKVSSLEEDFAKMGIAGKTSGQFFPSEKTDDGKVLSEGKVVRKASKKVPGVEYEVNEISGNRYLTIWYAATETAIWQSVSAPVHRVTDFIKLADDILSAADWTVSEEEFKKNKDVYLPLIEKFRGKIERATDWPANGKYTIKGQAKKTEESRDATEQFLLEGLSVQRTQRMAPGEKAAARRYRMKNKSKIARQSTLRSRKSKSKVRQARHAALKGNRSAGPRRRFILNQSALIQMRNDMNSLTELRQLMAANNPETHEKLYENFAKIARNAQVLTRKFAVLEEIKLGALSESVSIEHPESEHDWENPEAGNMNADGKEGDATEYASDSSLEANVDPEGTEADQDETAWGEMSDELELDFDIDFAGGDEDLSGETIEADDLSSEGEPDLADSVSDDLISDDDDDMLETVSLSYEMSKLRTEAEDMMSKLKAHTVSPEAAGSVLKDMLTYLGGAMKTYLDLASTIPSEFKNSEYAGQGEPQHVDAEVEPSVDNDENYIGQDDVGEVGVSPEDTTYKLESKTRKGKQKLDESVETTIDSMLANKVFMKNVDSMIEGAEAGITAATARDNKKALEFNKLSLDMFKAMKSGDRDEAVKVGQQLVKAGHGAAFGL